MEPGLAVGCPPGMRFRGVSLSVHAVAAQQAAIPAERTPGFFASPTLAARRDAGRDRATPIRKIAASCFSRPISAAQHPGHRFRCRMAQPYTAGLDRGVLYLVAPGTFENVYVFYDLPLVAADVRLEAVVENASDVTANNISLVCRADKDGWYEFSINSGGFWHIWKLADGQYTELATGPSRVINQKRGQNEIAATCIGSNLTLYVNYRKIGSARDRTFLDGGQVGVGLSAFAISGCSGGFHPFFRQPAMSIRAKRR